MASFISASGVQQTSITIPSHQANDLIVIHAYTPSSATVSLPAGWVNLFTTASVNSHRIAYKIAATNSETSGTWTNAVGLLACVYRPPTGSLLVPRAEGLGSASFNSSTISTNTSGNNIAAGANAWTIMFIAQATLLNNTSNVGTGMTSRSRFIGSTFETSLSDSNGVMTSYTGGTFSLGATTAQGRTFVCQIIPVPFPVSGGGGGGLLTQRNFAGGY